MSEFKWCGGFRGVWACEKDHPDHWVPKSEFHKHGDGLQGMCKACMSTHNYIQFNTSRPRHPVTGVAKMNWKRQTAKNIGGTPNEPGWQSYLDEAESLWNTEIKNHLLNTAPAQEVIAFIESIKSEFGQSKPMTKRTTTKVEGETVPEGWVYIVRNPDVPHILKIGKTFPDGIPDIMSSARRFGRAELINKYWFEEALKSEKLVHEELRPYNLRVLGYTDCGKELFKCGIDTAVSAINGVKKNWQYQKTSGGLIKNTPIGLQHSLV